MIIEVSFALVGGLNFGLERSWETVSDLIKRYPRATWKKIIDRKKNKCKYLVEISN
ncbi:hypothetical protein GOV14_02225 [Candidatus Pacearchaeota archaeon]|nr:hypothetical protein [Candidatus Pacearchaeota archaeon]